MEITGLHLDWMAGNAALSAPTENQIMTWFHLRWNSGKQSKTKKHRAGGEAAGSCSLSRSGHTFTCDSDVVIL